MSTATGYAISPLARARGRMIPTPQAKTTRLVIISVW
ncbi:hypothetical protein Nocox_37740 [Nonomuraea coxensis DSM 45129]|uniref:Uncharacterized protein n=1 Tax=Nonomuraea coxensis DSM 45129 TaxID=1122611 RepID=A0ABX8UBF0_9ACTN|nr:hypothetical protein Nocox_37740 [Nonomuraea coxensis DSM 45129]